jgi:hypothetical protein
LLPDRSAIVPVGDERGSIASRSTDARRRAVLTAVADLLRERGVNGFTRNEVLDATGIDSDEFDETFTADRGVVETLVHERVTEALSVQESLLRELDSLRGLQLWRDETVRLQEADMIAGRRLGALVSWTADHHEPARLVLKSGFESWQRYLAAGIRRMIVRGELSPAADAEALATSILAALQGGALLARTSGQIRPLEVALDTAVNQVRAHARPAADRTEPPGQLVGQEGADVVQGHVQGSLHRGDVMGRLRE